MASAQPEPPARKQQQRGQPTVLGALGLAAILLSGLARAELPPWAYGEQQRDAALVVDLSILKVEPDAAGFRVQGRVLALRRQRRPIPPAAVPVRVGSWLLLRLPPLPLPRPGPPLAGPSPLHPPRAGQKLTAWLEPGRDGRPPWLPAAGSRSFGPSLETVRDPARP